MSRLRQIDLRIEKVVKRAPGLIRRNLVKETDLKYVTKHNVTFQLNRRKLDNNS